MKEELKVKLLKAIENVLNEVSEEPDEHKRYANVLELKNVADIIQNYEEYLPDIKMMMNRKAKKDKWRNR